MILHHHTASCNIPRIMSKGHIWACATDENKNMSADAKVVWLTARPDDVLTTDADRELWRAKGWDDLAETHDKYTYGGCKTHPGITRITIKIANRRKRAVVPYYDFLDEVDPEFGRQTRTYFASVSERGEHWWLALQDIPITWVESMTALGPSAETNRLRQWLEANPDGRPPPSLHEHDRRLERALDMAVRSTAVWTPR